MNHATETKKLNNNGFSLVELIIVVAIMAVLVGVLAPQYLQYVEKSRYQADLTMIDEVKGAVEVAIATDDAVYSECIGAASALVTFKNTGITVSGTNLTPAVAKVIPDYATQKTTSKALKGVEVTLTVDANGTVKVNNLPAVGTP